jgi:hypothetical protein
VSTASLNAEELAILLRHTRDWVRAQCRAGRLPHHKVGSVYVFTPSDVEEILAATAVPVRPPDPPRPVLPRGRRLPTYIRVGDENGPPHVSARDERSTKRSTE